MDEPDAFEKLGGFEETFYLEDGNDKELARRSLAAQSPSPPPEDITQARINAYFERDLLNYESSDAPVEEPRINTALPENQTGLSPPPRVAPQEKPRTPLPQYSNHIATAGLIRSLLPATSSGKLPHMTGPFKLVRRFVDGTLVGQELVPHLSEPLSGPVFVYAVHFDEPASAQASGPVSSGDAYANIFATMPVVPLDSPARMRPWKLTTPLRKDGKERVRGPRKCGYCKKPDCRGRGGRQWCEVYKADRGLGAEAPPRKRAKSTAFEFSDEYASSGDANLESLFERNVQDSVLSLINSMLPGSDDDFQARESGDGQAQYAYQGNESDANVERPFDFQDTGESEQNREREELFGAEASMFGRDSGNADHSAAYLNPESGNDSRSGEGYEDDRNPGAENLASYTSRNDSKEDLYHDPGAPPSTPPQDDNDDQ